VTDARGVSWRDWAAALPDFALAAVCLGTWIAPAWLGPQRIGGLMLLMLVEFVVIHSAAFMGMVLWSDAPTRTRIVRVLGLGGFYSMFVAAFALGFHTWWPLAGFWILVLNRLLGALVGQAPSGAEREFVRRGWGAGAALYLLAVAVTTIAPVPRLGISAEVVRAADLPGSGLWIDEPYRVIAAAFLYFALLGWSELYSHRTFRERNPRAVEPPTK
jgi:hypothetical protein